MGMGFARNPVAMKKVILILIVGLLLSGCSEENSKTKKIKKTELVGYVDKNLFSKLLELQINNEIIKKDTTINEFAKIVSEPFISNMYSLIGGTAFACVIIDKAEKKMSIEVLDLMQKSREVRKIKCEIFENLYNNYDKKFREIANTKKIPPYYYFRYYNPNDDAAKLIGLFDAKDQCLILAKKFQQDLEYLISECEYFIGKE